MTHVAECRGERAEWDWTALRSLCLREAERVLGSCATAEDAAQEAVVRAWRRRGSCQEPERPAPWVTTIARREALRLARRPRESPLDELPAAAHPAHEPEQPIIEGAPVLEAIASLDREERWLVRARYWDDLTDRELARRLDVAEVTVRVRLHRLRSRLRDALSEP
jgi:RNA polymerase sigma-70 factor (ECF subfamily)